MFGGQNFSRGGQGGGRGHGVAALLMFSAKSATNMGMKHLIVIIIMMITVFLLSLSLIILRINTPIQTSSHKIPLQTTFLSLPTKHLHPILHQTNLTLTIHTFLICHRSTILHQIKPSQTLPTPILSLRPTWPVLPLLILIAGTLIQGLLTMLLMSHKIFSKWLLLRTRSNHYWKWSRS